jgi:hypothetical protein
LQKGTGQPRISLSMYFLSRRYSWYPVHSLFLDSGNITDNFSQVLPTKDMRTNASSFERTCTSLDFSISYLLGERFPQIPRHHSDFVLRVLRDVLELGSGCIHNQSNGMVTSSNIFRK